MGDIADMIIMGLLCESCGEFIESPPPGHPRLCNSCGGDDHDYFAKE